MKDGFTFFQGPSDVNLLRTGIETLLKPLNKTGPGPKDKPLY